MTNVRMLKLAMVAFAMLFFLTTNSIMAQTRVKIVQSSVQTAWFMNCEDWFGRGICLPQPYTWRALVRVEYESQGNIVRIWKIDQSVTMFGAGRNNPCNINLGISTDVYQDWGQSKVRTIPVTHPGSYIYSSNDRLWGGVSYPAVNVRRPSLIVTARAAPGIGASCTGRPSFSFGFNVP